MSISNPITRVSSFESIASASFASSHTADVAIGFCAPKSPVVTTVAVDPVAVPAS